MTHPQPPDQAQGKAKREDKIPLKEKSLFGTGAFSILTTNNIVEYQIRQGLSTITKSRMREIREELDACRCAVNKTAS